jgi:RNA polymerase sigma-70 factor (ECF subfamily)
MPDKSSNNETFYQFPFGDVKSIERLFKEFYPILVWFSFRIVNDQLVAEEIAEDSFIELWKRGGSREIKNIKSFLYTIVHNRSLNWVRDNKKNLERLNEASSTFDSTEESFIDQVIMAELIRDLHAAIEMLPPQCRKIFKLLYIEGKDVREAAEILNLAPGTIYKQQARGIAILKKIVSPLIIFFLFTPGFYH